MRYLFIQNKSSSVKNFCKTKRNQKMGCKHDLAVVFDRKLFPSLMIVDNKKSFHIFKIFNALTRLRG